MLSARFSLTLAALLAAALATGCGSGDASPMDGGGTLVLTGSSTIAPLAAEVARRFESSHPGVRVEVQTGGSSRGIADVQAGRADIAMVSRELKAGELQLRTHPVALDGICLIVHRDNPVESLTDRQVVAVFTGEITDWSEVGGPGSRIVVTHKAEGRGTLEVFLNHFGLDNAAVRPDVIVGENQQAIKTVAGNPLAIAYVSIGSVDAAIAAGEPIKALRAGEVAPTVENVANGRFPIARTLYLVTAGEPVGKAKAFIDFFQSPQVHDLVQAQYFVPFQR